LGVIKIVLDFYFINVYIYLIVFSSLFKAMTLGALKPSIRRHLMTINKKFLKQVRSDYAKVPNRIFRIGLSLHAIGLYTYLTSGAEEFHPNMRMIQAHLKIGVNKVYAAYRELLLHNVISIERKKRGMATLYSFVSPTLWT
jgi:hypothetical protein